MKYKASYRLKNANPFLIQSFPEAPEAVRSTPTPVITRVALFPEGIDFNTIKLLAIEAAPEGYQFTEVIKE